MNAVPAWVSYSVLRVLLFAVPLAALLALRIEWWIAAIAAALIGASLSFVLLRKPREKVARDLYQARHPDKEAVHPDAESEDAALDRAAERDAERTAAADLQRERESQ